MSKKIGIVTLATLIFSFFLIAGCGDSSVKSSSTDQNGVIVKDFEFSPAIREVPAGVTVTWKFEGPTPHSTTSDQDSLEKWDSGVLEAGKTYSHRFEATGSFPYHCGPHPSMKGTIVVR